MRSEYKIFRVFCVTTAVMLCALLVMTGMITANDRTQQTVFGKDHKIIQLYEREGGAVLNISGKIAEIESLKLRQGFDVLSYTVFAPINNVIELVKTISGILIHR